MTAVSFKCDNCEAELEADSRSDDSSVECRKCFAYVFIPGDKPGGLPAPDLPGVRPAAVRDVPRDPFEVQVASQQRFCSEHRLRAAAWRCESCRRYWCDECSDAKAVMELKIAVCACRGRLERFRFDSAAKHREEFHAMLGQSFADPLRFPAWIMLVVAGGTLWLPTVLMKILPLFLPALRMIYLIAVAMTCLFTVSLMFEGLRQAARGDKSPMDHPDVSSWWDDFFRPLIGITMAAVLYVGPGLALMSFHLAGGMVLTSVGVILLPLAVLALAMRDESSALNPVFVIGSALTVGRDAALIVVVTALSVACMWLTAQIADYLWVFGIWFHTTAWVYFAVVPMRALGYLYRSNEVRLKWF